MASSTMKAMIAPDTVGVREPQSPRYVLQGRAAALEAASKALGLEEAPALLRAATGPGAQSCALARLNCWFCRRRLVWPY